MRERQERAISKCSSEEKLVHLECRQGVGPGRRDQRSRARPWSGKVECLWNRQAWCRCCVLAARILPCMLRRVGATRPFSSEKEGSKASSSLSIPKVALHKATPYCANTPRGHRGSKSGGGASGWVPGRWDRLEGWLTSGSAHHVCTEYCAAAPCAYVAKDVIKVLGI